MQYLAFFLFVHCHYTQTSKDCQCASTGVCTGRLEVPAFFRTVPAGWKSRLSSRAKYQQLISSSQNADFHSSCKKSGSHPAGSHAAFNTKIHSAAAFNALLVFLFIVLVLIRKRIRRQQQSMQIHRQIRSRKTSPAMHSLFR